MERKNYIFQIDSPLVSKVYNDFESNYLIEYAKLPCEYVDNICAIYFSSHNIYYPNNEISFSERILKKNFFEWYGTRILRAKKHIFVRDIQKQWYLRGINAKINSIDKLVEFLAVETHGFDVITIGSSAGGYAAVVCGQLLQAQMIFSFNGQFELFSSIVEQNFLKNPIVYSDLRDEDANCYYSLRDLLKRPERIYYFLSKSSKQDIIQYNHIKDIAIRCISFRTAHHGIPFMKKCLSSVINLKEMELNDFINKLHHPLLFSARMIVFNIFLKQLISFAKNIINRLVGRSDNLGLW